MTASTRRSLLWGAGAALLAGPSLAAARRAPARGPLLIRGGAVVTMDAVGLLPRADVLVRDGAIAAVGTDLPASGAQVLDARDMIVMPGFVDTHWHLWGSLGRNFIADGFEYFAAKTASAAHYEPIDFYRSDRLGLAEAVHAGVTTIHNFAHNVRSPAHADAELRAHADAGVRALYSFGNPDGYARDRTIDLADLDRIRRQWFGATSPFRGLVTLGVNLRGPSNSAPEVFRAELAAARERGLPIAIHAGQGARPGLSAAEFAAQGLLGPSMLLVHYLKASEADRRAMAAAGSSLSLSMHSELRLGAAGDTRAQLMAMRAAGVNISLSFDANSLAPIDMFEAMRLLWSMGIGWQGTESEGAKPVGFREVLAMGTINGARALGLDGVTGSLAPGKRADILLVRRDDLNMAPRGDVEAALVLSAHPENVDTVLIDGRVMKRGGRVTGVDTVAIRRDATASAEAVRRRSGGRLAAFFD